MNHFILSDSHKCIGCKACEVACVMAHNDEQHVLTPQRFLPRITVIKNEQKRNAVTCHHCEGAPCARSCPNGAISQLNDSVQVNQEKCIGCKSCMVACPFGGTRLRTKLPGRSAGAGNGQHAGESGETAASARGASWPPRRGDGALLRGQSRADGRDAAARRARQAIRRGA